MINHTCLPFPIKPTSQGMCIAAALDQLSSVYRADHQAEVLRAVLGFSVRQLPHLCDLRTDRFPQGHGRVPNRAA
ncbi:hypothetical protein [Paracoccus sp. J56]|uniref:hypothetical protein n=1 Tax=Paracoccus sp. J56 TaxID=935850 RepID=UPI00111BFD22|nr:hypothetical protein [Paracoccus sp. J56]